MIQKPGVTLPGFFVCSITDESSEKREEWKKLFHSSTKLKSRNLHVYSKKRGVFPPPSSPLLIRTRSDISCEPLEYFFRGPGLKS